MAFLAKLSWAASDAHQGAAAAAGVPFSDCCVALHNGELLAAYGGMAACFPSRMAGLWHRTYTYWGCGLYVYLQSGLAGAYVQGGRHTPDSPTIALDVSCLFPPAEQAGSGPRASPLT